MSARVRRRRALAALLLVVVVVAVWTATAGRRQQSADAAAGPVTPVTGSGVASQTTTPSGGPSPSSDATASSSVSAAPSGAESAAVASTSPSTSASAGGATSSESPSAPLTTQPAPAGTLAQVAALGPTTAATVPAASTQAVVVRGDAADAATTAIELYERDARGWRRTGSWRGHLGAQGWTDHHRDGDLTTPVGTFRLSDSGGRLPDPGTELTYHQSQSYVPSGDGVFGDSLVGSFDYVLAVDYNRVPGRSPLDRERPLGQQQGGGIWLLVDHDGPTHGCVSVPEDGMRTLLRALLPAAHPVVVMGDRDRLAA